MDREVLSDPVGDILVHVGDRMELWASGFPPSPIHDIMFVHF